MSYCVNCGVELSPGEKMCPLCDVEVINPKQPWEENSDRPYPHRMEIITKHMNKKIFALFSSVILMIILTVPALTNIFINGEISWSLYSSGAAFVLFVWIVFPFYLRRIRIILFFVLDCIAVLLYLLLIEYMSGGNWFLTLGMPISVAASGFAILMAIIFSKKNNIGLSLKFAIISFAIGIFVVMIEFFINLKKSEPLWPTWSLCVLISFILIGIAFVVIEHKNNLKEEIRKRMYM